MKTKSTLPTLALAAAVLTASTQHAPAANVVGYVNVPFMNGYNFVADPLVADGNQTNNTLNKILIFSNLWATDQSGTKVYVWDVTNQVFLPPSTFSTDTSDWNPDYKVPVGKGFVIWNNAAGNGVTFVGEVLQGTLINFVAGSNKFSLLAPMVPVSTNLSGFGFPGIDGADCLLFDTPNQRYMDACTYFDGFGWFDPTGNASTSGPTINVAQSFFLQNPGPDINWGQNFTVQSTEPVTSIAQKKSLSSSSSVAPAIGRMRVRARILTLEVVNPSGGAYNVQHSTDGLTWTTVASHQTGAVWTGKLPGEARGYYQVVNP